MTTQNIPVSQFPVAIGLDGSEEVPIVQAGVTKRTTVNAISTSKGNVPAGGTTGQPLVKLSSINQDVGWETLPALGGGTGLSSYTLGDTLYSSTANTLARLSGNTTAVKQYLSQTGTGSASAAPIWSTINGPEIVGAALTKTDDANVTLTLGGNASDSLLRAASITAGWNGQLSVARGGTGVSSNTAYAVLCGGTISSGAIQSIASVGTATQVLTSNGPGALPTFQAAPISAAWSNTRLAKTTAYTLANGDKTKTIALGGSAFYTLTVNAASGYDSNYAVVITNEDAVAGKTMAFNGLAAFILWPGQTILLYNDNNGWVTTGPYRWRLTSATTLYVDPVLGNNSNDGLAAGSGRALQSIEVAINYCKNFMDLNGGNPTIQCAAGTYVESFVSYAPFVGGGESTIVGDPVTPSNCIWEGGVHVRDGCILTVNGFKFVAQTTGQTALAASQSSVLDFENVEFGAYPSGNHITLFQGGCMNCLGGSYVISGANYASHIFMNLGGNLTYPSGVTINMPNSTTFNEFILAYNGIVGTGGAITFTGSGSGSGSTGARYAVNQNGVVFSGGTTFPGNSVGSTATGGQFS